jgi:hypothetical protein
VLQSSRYRRRSFHAMGRKALASRLRSHGTRPRVAVALDEAGSVAGEYTDGLALAPADGPWSYLPSSAASRRFSFFAARFSFMDFAGFFALFFFGDLSPISCSLPFPGTHDAVF